MHGENLKLRFWNFRISLSKRRLLATGTANSLTRVFELHVVN